MLSISLPRPKKWTKWSSLNPTLVPNSPQFYPIHSPTLLYQLSTALNTKP